MLIAILGLQNGVHWPELDVRFGGRGLGPTVKNQEHGLLVLHRTPRLLLCWRLGSSIGNNIL
jgi:hypothetical protein